MGTTVNYGWTFPDRGFAPDGPAQIQALATAVDATLKSVDATDDAALATVNASLLQEVVNRNSAIAGVKATLDGVQSSLPTASMSGTPIAGAFANGQPVKTLYRRFNQSSGPQGLITVGLSASVILYMVAQCESPFAGNLVPRADMTSLGMAVWQLQNAAGTGLANVTVIGQMKIDYQ